MTRSAAPPPALQRIKMRSHLGSRDFRFWLNSTNLTERDSGPLTRHKQPTQWNLVRYASSSGSQTGVAWTPAVYPMQT
jgi:hypothetical protein